MQNNVPIHTAESSLEWLEIYDVRVLDWPPSSPDLNPIEHVWLVLKRTLYKLHPEFDTMGDLVEEFEAGLKEAWATIPNTLIKKLILSMPDRLEACKAVKGYRTKY
jgi:transposase